MKMKGLKKRFLYIYLPVFLLLFGSLHIAGFVMGLSPIMHMKEVDLSKADVPIVYNSRYNITFFGLENFHYFDSKKYGRAFGFLKKSGLINETNTVEAGVPANEDLLRVHSQDYIDSLRSSWNLARITELGFVRFFPTHLSEQVILVPLLYQTGGSLMASDLAVQKGWAINMGGGFHHASADHGEGFCALADISLSIEYIRQKYPKIKKAMIIDLDAHQGNGHGKDYIEAEDVFIFDIYNADVYPDDDEAKQGIDFGIELSAFTVDAEYLRELETMLPRFMDSFVPDIIFYVAGTDILKGDPLGALSVSGKGIIKRDEFVFGQALDRDIPIVMLFGGGYQKENAEVIARSIENLNNKFGIISAAKEASLSE